MVVGNKQEGVKSCDDNNTVINDGAIFARSSSDDIITDFANGYDRVDLTGLGLRNFKELSEAMLNAGADAVLIDLSVNGGVGSLLIGGLDETEADKFDFLL